MDARRKTHRKIFYSSELNAKKAAAEIRAKYFAWLAELEKPRLLTFSEGYAKYSTYNAKRRTIATNRTEGLVVAKHLMPELQDRPIAEISKPDLQRLINHAAQNGISRAGTMAKFISIIRNMWTFFAASGIISDAAVPIHFIMPSGIQAKKPRNALTSEEIALLFSPAAETASPFYIYHFRFILLTGLRKGELIALQTSRDFDGIYLNIRESLNSFEITQGKTASAQRRIRLNPLALDQIQQHHAMRRDLGKTSPALFCPLGSNDFCSTDSISGQWRLTCERIGLSCSLHELRHTMITYVRQRSEIPLLKVQQLVGHSKSMKTDDVYVHDIQPSEQERLEIERQDQQHAETIGSIFAAIIQPEITSEITSS